MTRCALSPAESCVRFHFDNHVVKYPAQIIDGSISSLEPLQIRIQPKPNVVDTQVYQPADVSREF
jgi:hypothetical protein